MDPKAIGKAKARLRTAEGQLDAAANAPDFETFSDHWYLFLVAAKNVYTQLEQGSKASAQSRQWFGAAKQARKDDPLLQYLFQARDDDEHGIENVVEHRPESLTVKFDAPPGERISVGYMRLDNRGLEMRGASHTHTVEFAPTHPALVPVLGRGGIVFNPPSEHLGVQLENIYPIPIGTLALAYLHDLVSRARSLA
jgi:hypothetical protein